MFLHESVYRNSFINRKCFNERLYKSEVPNVMARIVLVREAEQKPERKQVIHSKKGKVKRSLDLRAMADLVAQGHGEGAVSFNTART